MPKLIIGAPIYKREWILEEWLAHIERQTFPLEDIGFIFELGSNDEETHNILWEWHAKHPQVEVFDGVIRENVKHKNHPLKGRFWKPTDFTRMAHLRNCLLDRVRVHQPDRYYSLDSDILLEDPETIEKLFIHTEEYDAVGTLSYMQPPPKVAAPSVMTWRHDTRGSAYREKSYPLGTLFKADVIMASKMMTKQAYNNINYSWHKQGEDLGWSMNCAKSNLTLACAADIYTAHIMEPHLLDEYLENGDDRYINEIQNLV